MLEIYESTEIKQKASKVLFKVSETDKIKPDTWINLCSPTEAEITKVEQALGIPQEFIRYPLDEEERSRIDYDDDTETVLVIVDVPYSRKENDIIKYDTTPLGIILAKKHIVTVALKDSVILDHFIENRIKDLFIPYRTRFTIQILYAVAKEYLRLLRFIDRTLDLAEEELNKDISNHDLYKLLELSKSLVYFTSSLKADEAVLEKLMRGRIVKLYDEDEDLLEDVVIEYKQAHEMADIYANIVSNTTDAYASIIQNNTNDIMKILAAATICLTLPDIIGSFFGMNCPMPWDEGFASKPIPFFMLLLASILSLIISFIILRRKKMF